MVNGCTKASGPEEVNTVQIRDVYTPGGWGWGEKLIGSSGYPLNLKANNIQKNKLQKKFCFDSIYTGHKQDIRTLP